MGAGPRCIGLWLDGAGRGGRVRQGAAAGELSAIGNNINQLAHQANARGEATRAEIHAASELVQQAWRLVREAV